MWAEMAVWAIQLDLQEQRHQELLLHFLVMALAAQVGLLNWLVEQAVAVVEVLRLQLVMLLGRTVELVVVEDLLVLLVIMRHHLLQQRQVLEESVVVAVVVEENLPLLVLAVVMEQLALMEATDK